MRIFHYTVGLHIASILCEGLRPATAFVPDEVRPAVWFSAEQFWEPTANKRLDNGRSLDMRETEEHGCGLFRIEVPESTAKLRWADYRQLSGDSSAVVRGLARVARSWRANPSHWRVSFDPVPPDSFIGVEMLARDSWQPIDIDSFKTRWDSIIREREHGQNTDIGEVARDLKC